MTTSGDAGEGTLLLMVPCDRNDPRQSTFWLVSANKPGTSAFCSGPDYCLGVREDGYEVLKKKDLDAPDQQFTPHPTMPNHYLNGLKNNCGETYPVQGLGVVGIYTRDCRLDEPGQEWFVDLVDE